MYHTSHLHGEYIQSTIVASLELRQAQCPLNAAVLGVVCGRFKMAPPQRRNALYAPGNALRGPRSRILSGCMDSPPVSLLCY